MKLARTAVLIILVIQCTACGRRLDARYIQVRDAFQSNQGSTVTLSDHTDFGWDRVHFYGPYTPYDIIQNQTGYSPPTRIGQEYVEGENPFVPEESCVIVFTKNHNLLAGFLHPRSDFDSSDFSGISFSRDFARFYLSPCESQSGPRLEYPVEE